MSKKCLFVVLAFGVAALLPLHAQDMALLLMQGDLPYQGTTWSNSGSGQPLQQDEIKENWDKGYCIVSAAHTHRGWFVAMCRNSGYTGQSYYYGKEWPKEWLAEKYEAGYRITHVASDNSHWLFVVSQNTGYTAQSYITCSSNELYESVQDCWAKGRFITQATYDGDEWIFIMSEGTGITEQQYFFVPTRQLLSRCADEAWKEGYNLSLLEYGGGEYFLVASKNKHVSVDVAQSFQVFTSDSPQEFIKSRWDKDMDLAYVGGGYAGTPQTSTEYVLSAVSRPGEAYFTYPSSSYAPYSAPNGQIELGDDVDGKYTLTFDASKRGFCAADSLTDGSKMWRQNITYLDREAVVTKDNEGTILLIDLGGKIIVQADGFIWVPEGTDRSKGHYYDCNEYEEMLLDMPPYIALYPDADTNKKRMSDIERAIRQHGFKVTYKISND